MSNLDDEKEIEEINRLINIIWKNPFRAIKITHLDVMPNSIKESIPENEQVFYTP